LSVIYILLFKSLQWGRCNI